MKMIAIEVDDVLEDNGPGGRIGDVLEVGLESVKVRWRKSGRTTSVSRFRVVDPGASFGYSVVSRQSQGPK